MMPGISDEQREAMARLTNQVQSLECEMQSSPRAGWSPASLDPKKTILGMPINAWIGLFGAVISAVWVIFGLQDQVKKNTEAVAEIRRENSDQRRETRDSFKSAWTVQQMKAYMRIMALKNQNLGSKVDIPDVKDFIDQ